MVDLNLTKRQQEIFDFIKRYPAPARLPADGARHRQGDRPHLLVRPCTRTSANLEKLGLLRRDPTKPRAIERAGRQGAGKAVRRGAGCRWSARSPRRSPMLAEENIEEYVPVAEIAAATTASSCSKVKGDSMMRRRHPRGRPRRRAHAGHGAERRDRRRAWSVTTRRRVKRFFREKDHIRLQPENDITEADPAARDVQAARQGGRAAAEGCREPGPAPGAGPAPQGRREPRHGRPAARPR